MEHSLDLAQPWRTRALVASAVAALELAVLLAIAFVLLGRTLVGGVEAAARERTLPPAKQKPVATVLERSQTAVVVLNGNGISGAAGATAAKVRSLEYVVSAVGNAPRTNLKTMVMYRGKHRREAQRLAKDLRVKVVGPLDGLRASDLLGAHLAVIVGR